MHILDFLDGFPGERKSDKRFEYRLLCSGEIYNSEVLTTDWPKSDATRILVANEWSLIVCTHPRGSYPEELSLKFSAPLVTVKKSMFHPDKSIAQDIAAILCLFCRRLVTVAVKTREFSTDETPLHGYLFSDWSVGLYGNLEAKYWERKPATLIYGPEGIKDIIDYNPHPFAFNPTLFVEFLEKLSTDPYRVNLILAIRLYSAALGLFEHDADIAYQFLVRSIEAIANVVYGDFKPSRDEMIETKRSVYDLAIDNGMTEAQAEDLALEAAKDIPWSRRKFTSFIIDYSTDELWKDDDLFHVSAHILPTEDEFEDALKVIYYARSSRTHGGKSFAKSSVLGLGPTIPFEALIDFNWREKPFPPLVWFERVVNYALRNFVVSKNSEYA